MGTTVVIPALQTQTSNVFIISEQLNNFRFGDRRLCSDKRNENSQGYRNNYGNQTRDYIQGSDANCRGQKCGVKDNKGKWLVDPTEPQAKFHTAKDEFFPALGMELDKAGWSLVAEATEKK